MKVLLEILKWMSFSVASILILAVIAGLSFRLFGPEKQTPEGQLMDIGGFKLHINSSGEKSNKPTLVIEGGAGSASLYYHWLSEGLKDKMRVVRYDRAGLGYSDEGDTPRDPETIARELHTLLEISGESPPYILAGHSMGGPYIRVFTQLYPNEVVALAFLDATHPEQVERLNAPHESSLKYKLYMCLLKVQAFLGDIGVLGLLDRLVGPLLSREGLPEEINKRTMDFLNNGKYVRGYAKESGVYHSTLRRSAEASSFGSLPIRVFTAVAINREAYEAIGIDPEQHFDDMIK